MQALAALGAWQGGLAERMPELFLGITEPAATGQGQWPAHAVRGPRHPHARPPSRHRRALLGLTNVGLLPALARGLDAVALRAGAQPWSRPDGAKSRGRFRAGGGRRVAVGLAHERGIRAQ